MQLFSSYESLSWLLERFADKLVEIETSITTWQQDDRIRANILAGDGWATNPACLTIHSQCTSHEFGSACHHEQGGDGSSTPYVQRHGHAEP